MRRPHLAGLAIAVALLLPQIGQAQTGTLSQGTATCRERAQNVYSLNGWRHRPDNSSLGGCRGQHRYIRKQKERFWLYRSYRSVAPYKCQPGMQGYYAIPCSIIECESHFNWWARNSSGALWVYQLLGWGAPAPVNFQAKVANHRIAARVYAHGAGRSQWVC